MKAKGSRFVCFMIAVILLFTGMCSQGMRAGSSFATILNTSGADSIDKGDIDFSYDKACTNKLITGMREAVVIARRVYSRLNIRSILSFMWAEGISSNLFFYYATAVFICGYIVCSEAAILQFIHGQDGKK